MSSNGLMENITYQTVKTIRRRFNPLPSADAEEGQVSTEQEVCMWGDSGIPYLQQMIAPDHVNLNMKRGIFFAKIGAKITEHHSHLT